MKKKLVIIGDGEFAEIAYEYFTYDSDFEVIAFCVESDFLNKKTLNDLPVSAYEDIETLYPQVEYYIFVAIPSSKLNRLRTRFYNDLKRRGYRFATYISSKAFVWRNAIVGENTFIFESNVIQPFVKIGNNCILWSGNHVGHRTVIKDNVFISSHVVISGYCVVDENSFLGVNSTIADGVTVKKDNVIGAGATILKNTEEGKIYPSSSSNPSNVGSLRFYKVRE